MTEIYSSYVFVLRPLEIPGSPGPKALDSLTVEEVNGAFCYINEADFGRFLRRGWLPEPE